MQMNEEMDLNLVVERFEEENKRLKAQLREVSRGSGGKSGEEARQGPLNEAQKRKLSRIILEIHQKTQ